MKFFQFDQEKPSIIFADSSTGIDVATNPGSAKKRSKHWNPKFFLVKEARENGDIDLHKIPGPENPADATTKPLPETPHEMLLANSGYVTMVSKEGIEGVFMVCQKCKENNLVEVASAHTVKFEESKVAIAESHFAGVAESHLVKSGTPTANKRLVACRTERRLWNKSDVS